MLARYYKYTLEQITRMTPYQQLTLLGDGSGKQTAPGQTYFETEAEYIEWLGSRGKS